MTCLTARARRLNSLNNSFTRRALEDEIAVRVTTMMFRYLAISLSASLAWSGCSREDGTGSIPSASSTALETTSMSASTALTGMSSTQPTSSTSSSVEVTSSTKPASLETADSTQSLGVSSEHGAPSLEDTWRSNESAITSWGSVDTSSAPDDCSAFVMPEDCTIPEGAVLPGELRCTGLYEDWPDRTLRCGVTEYEPAYPLWSDGLEKRRFVWLPPGKTVDVTDPDDFRYPVGTQFWKEFGFAREDGTVQLAETRLLRKVSNGWMYTSYVWLPDGSNAIQENEGVLDWNGTGHSVPSRNQCKECHAGRNDFVLGWDGIMLGAGATGLTRESLLSSGLVHWDGQADGVTNPLDVAIPGDAVEQAALGYLHSNCGVSCHNETDDALGLETGYFMRLDADTLASVQTTDTFNTGLHKTPLPNAPLSELPPPPGGGSYVNLRPLDTERSLLLVRMKLRSVEAAMPRLGTNVVDADGVAAVQAWIEAMTPERGYPAPVE